MIFCQAISCKKKENCNFVLDSSLWTRYFSFQNMQELKEKIARSGQTLKAKAAAVDCTPQHLSAVLCGRARLTEKLKEKLDKSLTEIYLEQNVQVIINFPAAEWQVIRSGLPQDIDIEKTIKDFLWDMWSDNVGKTIPPNVRKALLTSPPPQE